jgi:hypothetical protein
MNNNCAEPNFLDTVVTGDESWIFAYDPERKKQSTQWKTKNSPRPKESSHVQIENQTIFIVFFDSKEILLQECVLRGQNVHQQYLITFLERLREQIRKEGPQM